MSKVLTVGTFDMPHSGHLELFRKCRKIAELVTHHNPYTDPLREGQAFFNPKGHYGTVVVGVNTDEFVSSFKNKWPVYPFEERFTVIAGLSDVDEVIINDKHSLQEMLTQVSPDFLVVGSDWACKDYYKQIGVTEGWLREHGITLLYVPYTENVSSTKLRERILNSESP